MTKRVTFSPNAIDALRNGALMDPKTPGLMIEAGASGARIWRYRRKIVGTGVILKRTLGRFPKFSIADARLWADALNAQIEAGLDPRQIERDEADRARLTVSFAHELYMIAVREGRASRAKKVNKPRTIADKQEMYESEVAPKLGSKLIFDISEDDLIKLVLAKGRKAKIRANRLAAELKVFFGWASSLRGREIGLTSNPAARLADLKFPEVPRDRTLSLDELGWFLRAVASEPNHYQRGMLLWLLSAARISEVVNARSVELREGVWTIPRERTKNDRIHRIALGPWGQSLFATNTSWVFPSAKTDGPRSLCGWYKARNRVLKRMEAISGTSIAKWTPHDMRRTARSNTKRLDVDFETAEAMLNHAKRGLERVYDGYELEDEKRAWFLSWEAEITRIAQVNGVAEALGVPHAPASNFETVASGLVRRRRSLTRGRGSQARRGRRPI